MNKRQVQWMAVGLYGFEYGIVSGKAGWDYARKRLRVCPDRYPDYPMATTVFPDKRAAVVTIGDIDGCKPYEVAAILAHEAMHIVQFIEDTIGEGKFSHEAEAYLLQYVAADLFEGYIALTGGDA